MSRHLGEIVRELRKDARLSVRELSRKARVDSGIISRLESQQQKSVKAENLSRLAQALGTTAEALIEGTTEDAPTRRDWPTLAEWLRRDRNLTERQRQAILGVYEGFVRPQ